MAATIKEAKVKTAIEKALLGIWPDGFHLMVVPTGFGQGGIPDHIFCAPVEITPEMVGSTYGMFVAVEAKSATGTLRGLQKVVLANLVKASAFAVVVKGLDQVPNMLVKLRRKFCLKM